MKIGSLFSGYGGLEMAVQAVLGGEIAWHAEIDKRPAAVLEARYPGVPNLGDITVVDWQAVEPIDVLTGGFPCQDVSTAGRRAGIRPGTRSGLWAQMAYIVAQLRPKLVVIENVRGLLSADAHCEMEPCSDCLGDGTDRPLLRALGAVLGDLASLGYDARWHGLRAADVGAPHGRFRIFIIACPADASDRSRGSENATGRHAVRQAQESQPLRSSLATADAVREGSQGTESAGGRDMPTRRAFADAGGSRLGKHSGESPTQEAGTLASDEPTDHRRARPAIDWGPYRPAVERWERVIGRAAPMPWQEGKRGGRQLSARFVEWMQGLPDGWVTDVLSRNAALHVLGNGVVPQQAEAALRLLLGDVAAQRLDDD